MARIAPDQIQLLGDLKRADVNLDAALELFVRELGDGNLAVGLRRLVRTDLARREKSGTLPKSAVDALRRYRPERAAAYLQRYPEQVAAPHRIPEQPGHATARTNIEACRELTQTTHAHKAAALGTTPDDEPDAFAGWD